MQWNTDSWQDSHAQSQPDSYDGYVGLSQQSRAEVGRPTLCCEPTDVGMLAKHIVETRAPLAWRASRIEVVADVPCELPPISEALTFLPFQHTI